MLKHIYKVKNMLIDERQNQILDIIKEKTFVRVDELASLVYASPATIRRDLALLDEAGLIQRLHGGASLIGATTGETSSIVRKQSNVLEKRHIAIKALDYIENGGCYFFDSSTTVAKIVQFLGKRNDVTIITNGLECSLQIASCQNCKGYIAGGEIQKRSASSFSGDVINFINGFTCDAFFFSCKGASLENGPTEGTVESQRCKAAMLKRSSKHILLVDHTKWNHTHLVSNCTWDKVDIVITDSMPPLEFKKLFEDLNIQLIIADK